MTNFFKISYAAILFGVMGFVVSVTDPQAVSQGVDLSVPQTLKGGEQSTLYSTPFALPFLIKIADELTSEVYPKSSASLNKVSYNDAHSNGLLYIIKSQQITISLTIRELIFPFHFFL